MIHHGTKSLDLSTVVGLAKGEHLLWLLMLVSQPDRAPTGSLAPKLLLIASLLWLNEGPACLRRELPRKSQIPSPGPSIRRPQGPKSDSRDSRESGTYGVLGTGQDTHKRPQKLLRDGTFYYLRSIRT